MEQRANRYINIGAIIAGVLYWALHKNEQVSLFVGFGVIASIMSICKFILYEAIYYCTRKGKIKVDVKLSRANETEREYKASFIYECKKKVIDYIQPNNQDRLDTNNTYHSMYYIKVTNLLVMVADYGNYIRKINYVRLGYYAMSLLALILLWSFLGYGIVALNAIFALVGLRLLLYGIIDISPEDKVYLVDGVVEENKDGREASVQIVFGKARHTYIPKYRFNLNGEEYKIWSTIGYGPARRVGNIYKLKAYKDGTIYEGDTYKVIICGIGVIFFIVGIFSTLDILKSI